MSNYLKSIKKKHKVYNKTKELPSNLDFLEGFDKITSIEPKFYDLVIYMDCGEKDRVGLDIDSGISTINFDHHQSNNNYATYNFVDIAKASTAEVVYEFFEKNNLPLCKSISECFYVGIYDDSLKFSSPRVDKRTFEIVQKLLEVDINPHTIAEKLSRRDSLAKYRVLPKILDTLELHLEGKVATIYLLDKWLHETGANAKDCDEVIDMILNIKIVDIAIFLRVINNKTRISLRSKNNVNVHNIAEHFDGGGHFMAAGCSHKSTDINMVKNEMLEFIKKDLS